jgi:transcriptional regulator with XRE-family HTH domain
MSRTLSSPRQGALWAFLQEKQRMADLTQREVAAKMGRQQSFVSAAEGGQHRVSVVELMDFAEAIGFDAARHSGGWPRCRSGDQPNCSENVSRRRCLGRRFLQMESPFVDPQLFVVQTFYEQSRRVPATHVSPIVTPRPPRPNPNPNRLCQQRRSP